MNLRCPRPWVWYLAAALIVPLTLVSAWEGQWLTAALCGTAVALLAGRGRQLRRAACAVPRAVPLRHVEPEKKP